MLPPDPPDRQGHRDRPRHRGDRRRLQDLDHDVPAPEGCTGPSRSTTRCTSTAATAARNSARTARRSTSATPGRSSCPGCTAGRRPRLGSRAPVRVRHLHRPLVRPGPLPPRRNGQVLLGYTCLRWGEATALRLCDIDLGRRRIDVRRAFSDVGGKIVLGTPESHNSPGPSHCPRFLARRAWPPSSWARTLTTSCSPPLRGSMVRLSNWRQAVFLPRPEKKPGSATGSAFTTCGTPPLLSWSRRAIHPRCCKRSSAMPASRPPSTCTGTCTPATWTSTQTASTIAAH